MTSQARKYSVLMGVGIGLWMLANAVLLAHAREPQHYTRIHFARGATIRTVSTVLSQRLPEHDYVLKVRAGQRMSLRVYPAHPAEGVVPLVLVTDPSGYSSGEKSDRFDTPSTKAGDYLITVATNMMASNGTRGTVRLKIWVK